MQSKTSRARSARPSAALFARALGLGCCVCAAVCGASVAQAAPGFPTPTGRVVYALKTTGAAAMNGTIDMRWVQGGQRFRQDMAMAFQVNGRSMGIKSWTIFDGKSMYVSMPDIPGMPKPAQRSVFRMKLPPDYLERMGAGGGMVPGGGGQVAPGKVVGRGTVLGKPCVVRASNLDAKQGKGKIKLWMWNNLPLRTELDMVVPSAGRRPSAAGKMRMTMVATKLEANVAATPTLFRVPAGVKIQEMPTPRR